ncbi:hypothetical protein [Azospirillum argentinense]
MRRTRRSGAPPVWGASHNQRITGLPKHPRPPEGTLQRDFLSSKTIYQCLTAEQLSRPLIFCRKNNLILCIVRIYQTLRLTGEPAGAQGRFRVRERRPGREKVVARPHPSNCHRPLV